jgi:hypothetical protein
MSYGRIKRRLKALINRKDLTDELAGDFVLDAIAVLERDIRIGPMEIVIDKSDWDGTLNAFPVPPSFLGMINIFTDDGGLEQVDLDTLLSAPKNGQCPRVFARVADRWLLRPVPSPGQYVYLHFHGETSRPTLDTDTSVWTEAGFLATLYKAAELAADFFQMEPEQTGSYASKAQAYAEAISGQDLTEQWAGRIAIGAPKDIGEY